MGPAHPRVTPISLWSLTLSVSALDTGAAEAHNPVTLGAGPWRTLSHPRARNRRETDQ